MSTELARTVPTEVLAASSGFVLPAVIADQGEKAAGRNKGVRVRKRPLFALLHPEIGS